MSAHSSLLVRACSRRAQYLSAAGFFGILGFHVGVWAVQLAPLSAGIGMNPAALGTAVTITASAGMITLLAGGALADRLGRRPVLVIGFGGTAAAFVLFAVAGSFPSLLPALVLYGLAISFVDLGANAVGSAYEHAHATTAMADLHAWFSAGALTGAISSAVALRAGISYRGVYLALAAVMAAGLAGAIGGLLLVGFAIAPVVPATLSLAGRSAPGHSGQAIATATAAGYTAFIISPLTIGLLAQVTGLRLALSMLILTSLAIAGLATRWPSALTPAPAAASRQQTGTRCTQGTRSQPEPAGTCRRRITRSPPSWRASCADLLIPSATAPPVGFHNPVMAIELRLRGRPAVVMLPARTC